MIKTFCDICEEEIGENNSIKFPRLKATLKGKYRVTGNNKLEIEVLTGLNGTTNAGDFCKYCILDALYRADDRPREYEEYDTKTT